MLIPQIFLQINQKLLMVLPKLLVKIFDEKGSTYKSCSKCRNSLPLGVSVEVDAIFEIN